MIATNEDAYVTLTANPAAWRIEFTLVPKAGVIIGCWDYLITQEYGAGLSEQILVMNSDGQTDYDSRYSAEHPFTAAIDVWNCSLIDEEKDYSITVMYDLYENGILLEQSRSIGVQVTTEPRHQEPPALPGTLPIEVLSAFEGRNMCTVSIGIGLQGYNGTGTVSVTADVTGLTSGKSKTIGQGKMYYTETTVTGSDGERYKRAFYTFTVLKEDLGYGKIKADVEVIYKVRRYDTTVGAYVTDTYTSEGSLLSKIPFRFLYLVDGGDFKLTAAEWNEFIHLLVGEISRHGGVAQNIPIDTVERTIFSVEDVLAARALFRQLRDLGVAGMPGDSEFPAFTRMWFGGPAVGSMTAYELFSRLEMWAAASMDS